MIPEWLRKFFNLGQTPSGGTRPSEIEEEPLPTGKSKWFPEIQSRRENDQRETDERGRAHSLKEQDEIRRQKLAYKEVDRLDKMIREVTEDLSKAKGDFHVARQLTGKPWPTWYIPGYSDLQISFQLYDNTMVFRISHLKWDDERWREREYRSDATTNITVEGLVELLERNINN